MSLKKLIPGSREGRAAEQQTNASVGGGNSGRAATWNRNEAGEKRFAEISFEAARSLQQQSAAGGNRVEIITTSLNLKFLFFISTILKVYFVRRFSSYVNDFQNKVNSIV